MFTDIVGSTELAAQFGDRAWKALVSRHNSIVRRELKRFAGRELDTAGDGFFVMFERPAQAIDCAWAILDSLAPLKLQIRAAIHMGEVEVMGGKVGGIAVHAASRVLSLAKPGQIYVTGIVHDVVAGSDIRFADEGVHELRGVPGEWRIFAVEEAATDRALPVEPVAEPAARNWPLILAVVGLVALVAAIGTALVLADLSRPPPVVPHANSVVRVSPDGNAFVSLVDIEDPTDIAIDSGAVWVLSASGRTLNRIDVATRAVATVGLPAIPTGMAAGDGTVWITTGFGATAGEAGLFGIGMASRQIEDRFTLGYGVEGVAIGEGAVWVTNRIDNTLTRIDLTTQVVAGVTDVGEQPSAVVVGDGSVWVANAIDRTIWRIDPITLTRTAEITLAAAPYDLALGFGRLWVTSEQQGSVTLIDVTTNTIQQTLTMRGAPRGVSAGPDDVWVAIGNGELIRIDPDDPRQFSPVVVGGALHDVAADVSGTWVSVRE
jgi:streptogramin lyase